MTKEKSSNLKEGNGDKDLEAKLPESFNAQMDWLAADEEEAIEGYDKVLLVLDPKEYANAREQIEKIRDEEVAHKEFLETLKTNKDAIYKAPGEASNVKDAVDLDGDASDKDKKDESLKEGAEEHKVPGKEYVIYDCSLENEKKAPIVAIRSTYTEAQWYCNKPENFDKDLCIEEVPVGKFKKGDDFYGPFDDDWNLIDESFYKEPDDVRIGNTITYWTKYGKTKKAKVIDITDEGIFLDNEDVIRFGSSKKPHDRTDLQGDYIVDIKEDIEKTEFELPVEVYDKPEDIIRINDELDKKAREGKLIGIRKEKKLLQLAEPAINGIWNIYLNDKGFIEKIVLF